MEEVSPLLDVSTDEDSALTSHISDKDFFRQTLTLISCLFLLIGGMVYIATLDLAFGWIMVIIASITSLYTMIVLWGFYIWNRGQLPLVKDEEAKYINVKDNNSSDRVVEYYTWGSSEEDAIPLVVLHGSGATGKHYHQLVFPAEQMKALNVKVISPSYPGHGGSDVHRYRRITDWPRLDLLPILEREGVGKFITIGCSYGTAHAMATASALPERCLGVGLCVPYLPENICRETKMWTDADMILREKQLETPWTLLPVLACLSVAQFLVAWGIKHGYPEGIQAYKESPDVMKALEADAERCFQRGVNGQVYEMTDAETTQTWPDPRDIRVKNIAVWYAGDDGIVPPDHGKWLAENIALSLKDRNVNIRNDAKGLGHFTYFTPEHCKTGIMTQVLLDMIAPTRPRIRSRRSK